MSTSRSQRLSAVGVVLLGAACSAASQDAGDEEWPRSTLAEQGADAGPIDSVIARARAGEFGNVNHIVVVRDGARDRRKDRARLSRDQPWPGR